MAFDFTLSTGSRDSRMRRSQSSVSQRTQSPSVTRQVIREAPTVTADPGESPIASLAGTLGQFFGKLSEEETKNRLLEEKERNEEAIAEAKRRVLENPEAAREAVRTNDFSMFIPDDELRTRKSVIDGFMAVAGASAAQQEWAQSGEEFINGLSADQDPAIEWQKYLANKIEGANPLYSDQYFSTGMKLAGPTINKFQNARFDHMVNVSKEQAENILTEALKQQSFNPSSDFSLEAIADQAYAGVPIPPPLREAYKRETMGSVLRIEAARGNRAASDIYFKERVNPEDKSSPTWDRYFANKGQPFHKIQEAVHQEAREKVSVQTSQDIERVIEELRRGERPLGEVVGALQYWVNEDGVSSQNDRIVALQKEVLKMLKDQSIDRLMIDVVGGRRPVNSISPSDAADVTKWLDANGEDVRPWAQAVGIPTGQAQKIVDDLLANGYASDKLKKKFAGFLFDTGVSIEVRQQQLSRLVRFSNRQLRNVLPSSEADQIIAFADLYRMSPEIAQKNLRVISQSIEDGRSIVAYHQYDKDYTNEKFTDEVRSKLGSIANNMEPGSFKRVVAVANMLAIAGKSAASGKDAVAALYTKESLQAIRGADGTVSYRLPDGMDYASKDELTKLNEKLQKDVGEDIFISGTSGILGGLQISDRTGKDAAWIPGQISNGVWVNPKLGEKIPPHMEGFSKTTYSDGRIKLMVPPAPKENESHVRDIGNNMAMVWENGIWSVRYDHSGSLKSKNIPIPPNADQSTRMLHRELSKRSMLEREIAELSEPITGKGNVLYTARKNTERKKRLKEVLEQKSKIDTTIKILSKNSGANQQISKLLKQFGVASGNTPGLTTETEKLDVDPTPVTPSAQPEEIVKKTSLLLKKVRQEKREMNHADLDDPAHSFTNLVMPHMTKHEGFSNKAYKDADAVSIAYGWNLSDDDVVKVLSEEGYSVSELKSGKATINRAEADRIMPKIWNLRREWTVKQVGEDVWKYLTSKQRVALTSLAYNAKGLIGPGLKDALKRFAEAKENEDEDMLEMALWEMNYEVRHNSLPFNKYIRKGLSHIIPGLLNRRNEEADMLLGSYVTDEHGTSRFPSFFPDWKSGER